MNLGASKVVVEVQINREAIYTEQLQHCFKLFEQ